MTATRSITPRLVYGSLDLTAPPFEVETDTDLSGPEAVRLTLESRLYDGDILYRTRSGNRSLQIPLRVRESDLAGTAIAEALLTTECDKPRNTLAYDPGDNFGPVTVFDAFASDFKVSIDTTLDRVGIRRITLTIPALPFGRSATQTTSTLTSLPPAGTTMAAMETTSGWTSTAGPITSSGTWYTQGSSSVQVASEKVLTVSTPVALDVYEQTDVFTIPGGYTGPAGGGAFSIAIRHSSLAKLGYTAGGVGLVGVELLSAAGTVVASVTPSAVEYLGGASAQAVGFYRYAFPLGAGVSVGAIRFRHRMVQRAGAVGVPSVWYDNLSFADTSAPSKHSLATIPIVGAVRAPGSIAVASPSSAALGDVLVLTTDASDQPPTFLPACRAAGYQSAGTNTTTAGLLNASTAALSTAYTGLAVDVPVASIAAGTYEVWLRCTNASATTFAAQAQVYVAGTAVGAITSTEGDSYAISAAHRWVSAGRIQLPPQAVPVPDPSAAVRVQLKVTTGTAAVDEVVLAPVEGACSVVALGTGTASASGDSSRFWMDAPSVEQRVGGWFRGTSDDRVNARSAGPDLVAPGRHVFSPSSIRVYVATSNVAGATTALSYYATYHTSAAS